MTADARELRGDALGPLLPDRALSITAAAAEAPDAIALVTPAARFTYRELAARAAAFALGAPLVAAPTVDTIVAILAHLEAHRPMGLIHHRAPDRDALIARLATAPPENDTLAVAFTSGSTGAPRGVLLSRTGVRAALTASAAHLGAGPDDAWLVALPLAHVGGLAALLRALVARRPAVFLDGDFDRAAVAALLHHCTHASLVPTQLAALLDDEAWRPPPSLRAILLGGAAAPAPLLAAARARGVPVIRTYGMTETFGQVATQRLADAGDPDAPLVPLPGIAIAAGTPDAPALIRVDSPARMLGYLGEPPLADRWLATSDLGAIVDGGLRIAGRADDVIITGGENVHPAVVEAALASAPGVRACCAVGLADARWGQIVALAVVPGPGFDPQAILAHGALAPHQRPRRVITLAALPLGPTGKIDRRAVAALLASA
ncbi:MAG: AMP-binding protein [Deltaproteobacteria bacterium]|nr:AMP-binding protein [Deltaproteobacteria bacterium]